jgi:hypothetical protein
VHVGSGTEGGSGAHATRTVLIHAGSHKTGTTSLQDLFTSHRGALRERGILYPFTGVLPNGTGIDSQTNIAWELMAHNSYDPAVGTLDDLITEATSSGCEKVLLSSEEFARLFDKPARLLRLRESFEDAGFVPRIGLVFRDMAECADTLFVTLLAHGLELDHEEFVRRATEEGKVTIKGNSYCFDRGVITRSFVDVFGDSAVTCIDYDYDDAVGRFLDAFDWFFEGALDGADTSIRANTIMDGVERLRASIRAGETRIAGLEAEVENLRADVEWLRARRAATERRLSFRLESRLRSVLAPRRS